MAACGGFLESLSPWKQIKSMKPVDDSASFTELFGELHFKDVNKEISSSSPTSLSSYSSVSNSNIQSGTDVTSIIIHQQKVENPISNYEPTRHVNKNYRHSDSFSSMSLCTEGLGSESSDDVEDLMGNDGYGVVEWIRNQEERRSMMKNVVAENNHWVESRRSRICRREIPPPISCIGRNGKPWVCFKSFREDGRFILKQVRIPTQDFLHACRENGRLRLRFVHPDDEILEEDDDEDEPIEKQHDEEENGETSQGATA